MGSPYQPIATQYPERWAVLPYEEVGAYGYLAGANGVAAGSYLGPHGLMDTV